MCARTPCPSGRLINLSACSQGLREQPVIQGEAGWTPAMLGQIPLLGTLNLQRDSVQLQSVDTHVSPELQGSVD